MAIETRLPERVNREDHLSDAAALLPHVQALVTHLKTIPDTGLFSARLLNRLAPAGGLMKDPSLEQALLDQALELVSADSSPDMALKGSILSNLSNLVVRTGDVDRAIAMAHEALDAKRAAGSDPFTVGITVGVLGTHVEGRDPEAALAYFREATGLLQEAGEVRDLAESYLDQARVLYRLGRAPDSIEAAKSALEAAADEPDAWSERSAAYIGIANVYEFTGEGDPLQCAEAAVSEAEACPVLTASLAQALGTRGRLRGIAGELPESVVDLRRACAIFRDIGGESQDYCMALGNLGRALLVLGNASDVNELVGEGLMCFSRSRDLLAAMLPEGHPTRETGELMLAQARRAVFGNPQE